MQQIKGVNMTNYIPNKKRAVSTAIGTNICRRLSGQDIIEEEEENNIEL